MNQIPQELDERLVAIIRSDRVKVPPYPAIAMRMTMLLKRPDYSMAELAALVTSDQALSAAVLRAANSARMRTGSAVTSLSEAVSRVGSNELIRLAFAIGLGKEASKDGVLLDLRRMVWRQAVWSAFMCRELARRWKLDPDAAFLCGLLHDFGRVIALACVEEILVSSGTKIQLSSDRTVQVVEAYHIELGMVMAEKWSLPAMVAEVIRDHHYVTMVKRDQVGLVRATDQIVTLMESSLVVERTDLDSIDTLTPEERDFVTDLLPALPGLVEGLDPQAGTPMPRVSQYMRIAIDNQEPAATEDVLHHADLEASCQVFGDETRCNVIGIGSRRLQVLSPRAYAPQTVIQIALDGDEGPFRMWCTLSSIRPQMRRHGERFVLELKPFALTAVAKLGWAQLLATRLPAGPTGQAAS